MKIYRGDSVVLGCVQDDVIYIHKVRDEDLPEYDVKVIDFNK